MQVFFKKFVIIQSEFCFSVRFSHPSFQFVLLSLYLRSLFVKIAKYSLEMPHARKTVNVNVMLVSFRSSSVSQQALKVQVQVEVQKITACSVSQASNVRSLIGNEIVCTAWESFQRVLQQASVLIQMLNNRASKRRVRG